MYSGGFEAVQVVHVGVSHSGRTCREALDGQLRLQRPRRPACRASQRGGTAAQGVAGHAGVTRGGGSGWQGGVAGLQPRRRLLCAGQARVSLVLLC